MRTLKLRLLLLCVGLCSFASPLQACMTYAEFNIEDIRSAGIVVTGELVDYDKISLQDPGTLSDYAILTIRTQDTLIGSSPPIVRFTWDNSTFDEPPAMAVGEKVIVAGIDPSKEQPPLRGPSATVFPAPRQDMMRVLQAPCSGAFIFAHTPRLETDLRALLRGENVKGIDYSTDDEKLFQWKSTSEPQRELTPAFVGSIGLAVFAAFGIFMFRRWTRNQER